MKHASESGIDWVEQRSPKGKFHVFRRHISVTLGAPRDAGVATGGHPFEAELTRIPPGAASCPYHAHAAQWEPYLIQSGSGEVRAADQIPPISPGDTFICPPGEAHQIRNTGDVDLCYYIIADNPPADLIDYPDSGKWFVKPQRKSFTMREADYYEGEE